MSETYTARVDAYAEPQHEEIARRAGLDELVGTAVLASTAALTRVGLRTMTAAVVGLREEVSKRAAELQQLGAVTKGGRRLREKSAHQLTACVAHMQATLAVLERPEFGLLLAAARKEGLGELTTLRQRLAVLQKEGERDSDRRAVTEHARAMAQGIDRALAAGGRRVLNAEAAVLTDAVTDALTTVGYHVAPPRQVGNGTAVMRGTNDEGRAIYLAIDHRRGHLTADMAGFEGTACEAERDGFLRALGARGVGVRLLTRDLHGRPEGGGMVREAGPLFESDAESETQRRIAIHRSPEQRERLS